MQSQQTLRVLNAIMTENSWEQQDLARLSGVDRTTVSHHLNGSRPIREMHLKGYLVAVARVDRPRLFAAWAHDLLADQPEVYHDLFEMSGRLQSGTKEWSPELSAEHRRSLEWWDLTLRTDPQAAELFEIITRREQGR